MAEEAEKKKRGRPKKGFGTNNKKIQICLPDYQLDVIKNACEIKGISISEFGRDNLFFIAGEFVKADAFKKK